MATQHVLVVDGRKYAVTGFGHTYKLRTITHGEQGFRDLEEAACWIRAMNKTLRYLGDKPVRQPKKVPVVVDFGD